MTDNEIKNNLMFIAHYCHDEYNEIRVDVLLLEALDLINRQQAEIERLKEEVKKEQLYNLRTTAHSVKAEAIKEFWSRLQGIAYRSELVWSHGEHPMLIELDDAEEIYEEMVGESNA